MADQFELLSPGSACTAALPLNPVSDEYVFTRLVPLVVAQADGGTQPAVLPPQVLHPKLAEFVTRHRPDLSIRTSGEALVAKWRTAAPQPSATTASAAAGPTPPASTTAPTLLPSLALAVYFPYRQTWSLLGYSRGALLNSISLVPQEETTIEVFTWDRVKRARDETLSVEEESSQEVAFTDKDSREVLKELTRDSSFTFQAGLKLQIPVAPDTTIGGSVDAGTKDSLRDVSRATQQTVNEAVRKASSRMKTSRQTKVTETEETGSETRVTRKLRNPNMSRTLNVDHFEVLATYQVTTTLLLSQARLCVLVNNPVGLVATRGFLLANEGVLRRVLLSRLYAAGFDAARLLAARDHLCEIKCAAPCPCDQPSGTPPGGNPAVEAARQHVTSIAGAVAGVINTILAAQPDDLIALGSTCSSAGGEAAWASAKTRFHRWLYARLMDTVVPRWGAACREFAAEGADRSPEAAERFLLTANAQPAVIFNVGLLSIIYFGKALEFVASISGLNVCAGFVLVTNIGFDDAALDTVIGQLRGAVAAWRAALAAPPPPPEDAGEEEPAPAAAPEFPAREVARALVDEAALVTHLNANASYYRYALWQALSPGDRAHLLHGVPNLPQFVDDEVLGFIGDKMALPFRLSADSSVREWFEGNVLNNAGLQQDPPQPFTVTLPTPAVTLETRLGQCDACEEFITQHRVLDLQHKTAEVALQQQRAEQQKLETQRYQARLAQKQPMLESPDPEQGALRVIIEGDQKVAPPPK